jgi:hypothetical protein
MTKQARVYHQQPGTCMALTAGDGNEADLDAGPCAAKALVNAAGEVALRCSWASNNGAVTCINTEEDSLLCQDFWRHGEQSTASMSGSQCIAMHACPDHGHNAQLCMLYQHKSSMCWLLDALQPMTLPSVLLQGRISRLPSVSGLLSRLLSGVRCGTGAVASIPWFMNSSLQDLAAHGSTVQPLLTIHVKPAA